VSEDQEARIKELEQELKIKELEQKLEEQKVEIATGNKPIEVNNTVKSGYENDWNWALVIFIGALLFAFHILSSD